MGCTWIFELVSWGLPLPPQYCWVWYFTDTLNMLQGLWIFLIYVAKPAVYRKIMKKLKCGGQNQNTILHGDLDHIGESSKQSSKSTRVPSAVSLTDE